MNQKQQDPTHTNIYPKIKVILAYIFVTPMIGLMILFASLLTIPLLNQQNMNDYGFALIMVFLIIALVIAIIPALMTGIWVAKSQIYF